MEVPTDTEMITKDNAAQWLPLVQALAEGKQLQWRVPATDDRWLDADRIEFDELIKPRDYRIKPEPRRFRVAISKVDGRILWTGDYCGLVVPEVHQSTNVEIIEVVEVLK